MNESLQIYSERAVSLLEAFKNEVLAEPRERQTQTERMNMNVNVNVNTTSSALSVGIRGRSNYSDSEEDNGDDDDDSSSDTNSSTELNGHGMDADMDMDTNARQRQRPDSFVEQSNASPAAIPNMNGNRRKNKKRSKEDIIQKIGSPPKVSITIDIDARNDTATILHLPAIFLQDDTYRHCENEHQYEYEYNNSSNNNKNKNAPLHDLYQLSTNLNQPLSNKNAKNLMLILILRSGRYAAGIFHKNTCIHHTTSTRYTTRKGQGGAQSSNDNSKGKAKSVGSQLRRAGEQQLRQDVKDSLTQWQTLGLLNNCALFFISVSKSLQKGFWDDVHSIMDGTDGQWEFHKKSPSVKRIPLDVGRPSHETCCAVQDVMTRCHLEHIQIQDGHEQVDDLIETAEQLNLNTVYEDDDDDDDEETMDADADAPQKDMMSQTPINGQGQPSTYAPLSLLHEAAKNANIQTIVELLSPDNDNDNDNMIVDEIDARAGPDQMTPLHYAASAASDTATAAACKCIHALLTIGRANPCVLDSRSRPPYFVSANDKIRNSFRKARAELGEEVWDWSKGAKVGPPLSEEDVLRKKQKAAEKKRKQRQRRKQRKTEEEAEAEEKGKEVEVEQQRTKTDAKDILRTGVGVKGGKGKGNKNSVSASSAGKHLCDFCQKACKFKSKMFSRLDFHYCSTDCVKRHQRELMAAAATSRLKS